MEKGKRKMDVKRDEGVPLKRKEKGEMTLYKKERGRNDRVNLNKKKRRKKERKTPVLGSLT